MAKGETRRAARTERGLGTARSQPITHQRAAEIQEFGKIARLPIGLDENVCAQSVGMLNQILADTMTLRDLYKKHHWQVAGETFYQLHLLFDKHFGEQAELVDSIAERVQLLGGISIRTNELQVWFLAEHLVDVPMVRADQAKAASSGR